MKLFALRHGKTTWNEEGRIMGGGTHGELTVEGLKAAESVAKEVLALSPSIIYCSDLKRAKQTIKPILVANSNLECVYTKELRERDLGDLDGRLMSEIDWDGYWKTQEDIINYNSEPLRHFTKRIYDFCASLDKNYNTVLLITHIGVMNRLKYLEDPAIFEYSAFPNTQIVEFNFDKIIEQGNKLF